MKRTLRSRAIAEYEALWDALVLLSGYAEEGVMQSYYDEKWEERKDWLAHSHIMHLRRRIEKDLRAAKANRYDTIVQHYEQLCILDTEGNLELYQSEQLL